MGGSWLSGVRRTLSQRSRKEKVAGVAALALVASAPFGGLNPAGEQPAMGLRLNDTTTIGPYDVTFLRAYRVKQFAGTRVPEWSVSPFKPSDASRQLLVLEVDVTNGGKRPEYAHVLTKAVSIGGAAKVDSFDGPTTRPGLIYRADRSNASILNPGMTHRLALVVEQPVRVQTPRATVAVRELMYVGKGGLASNLDEDYWLHLDGTARRGTIPVASPASWERHPQAEDR
jgi:hypothetical protein